MLSDNHISRAEALRDDRLETDGKPAYRCAICGEVYPSELLARTHVTRADDLDHCGAAGINATEYVPVEVIDEEGEVLIPLLTACDPRKVNGISVSTVPDDDERLPESHDRRHRLIIQATVENFDTDYTDIWERATELIEDEGLEALSYENVRRTVRRYFAPRTASKPTIPDGGRERLSDLEPMQQAVIIASLANREASDADIAQRVGCAQSYPSQVRDRASTIISRLEDRIDEKPNVEHAVASELDDRALRELRAREYLGSLGVDIDTLEQGLGEHDAQDEAATESTTEAATDPTPDAPETPAGVSTASEGDSRGLEGERTRRMLRQIYGHRRFYRMLLEQSSVQPDDFHLVFPGISKRN